MVCVILLTVVRCSLFAGFPVYLHELLEGAEIFTPEVKLPERVSIEDGRR